MTGKKLVAKIKQIRKLKKRAKETKDGEDYVNLDIAKDRLGDDLVYDCLQIEDLEYIEVSYPW